VRYSGLKPDADLLLIISHVEPEIRVTRKSLWRGQEHLREATYYSDGRGETASKFLSDSENKSKSGWEGDKFVTQFSVAFETHGRGRGSYEVRQEWQLSADGKTLTQTERIVRPISTTMASQGLNSILQGAVLIFPGEVKSVFHRVS
jgi:hypothetical protein